MWCREEIPAAPEGAAGDLPLAAAPLPAADRDPAAAPAAAPDRLHRRISPEGRGKL